MKTMIRSTYGSPDVLRAEDVAVPIPAACEVLVEVRAMSLNKSDWLSLTGPNALTRLAIGGLFRPKHATLGADIAGRVKAVGASVKQFKPGDEVFGDLSGNGFGGLAEYVCAPESVFAVKPPSLSFEEAAALPMAGVTALQGLRDKANVHRGQTVLINGASGGVGTFGVQIANAYGASVTAVCSTRHIELVQSLGAEHVIDYTKEDFTKQSARFDAIFAVNGDESLSSYRRLLAPRGVCVVVGGSMSQIFQALLLGPLRSKFGNKTLGSLMVKPSQADLTALAELAQTGRVRPVIDRCFPFNDLGEGHASGKVVVSVSQP
jgi:NADPH:quinone reductase-like Zn-dependent oxidoreductase